MAIFKNASGSGTFYSTPLDEEFFDGYDPNRGNLFADGFTGDRSGFALVELPKGSTKFVTIKTSNSQRSLSRARCSGTAPTSPSSIRTRPRRINTPFSGTTATLKNTVSYSGTGDCAQTWIVQGPALLRGRRNYGGEVFSYPAGGSPIANLGG